MNRRKVIRNIAIAAGGVITLPGWMMSCGISDTPVHPSSFSPGEQQLLASIADTIIPAGNSIGALSVEVDKYLQKIFDDCYEQEVQENIKRQLNSLTIAATATFRRSFPDCEPLQRQELLRKLFSSADKAEQDFFDLIKSETIKGFTTSQQVMQEYLQYKVAPGHYYGCIDLKS